MNWSTAIITEPTVEPISLQEAKDHLRIRHSDEDTDIERMITAARRHAEQFTGRAFISQRWRLTLDYLPSRIYLPWAPLTVRDVVSNGSFDSSTGWTLPANWVVGSGKVTNTIGNDTEFAQEAICTDGDTYFVEFRMGGHTGGTVTAAIDASGTPTLPGTARSTTGTFGEFIVSDGTDLRFYPSLTFNGWVDDVRCCAGWPIIEYRDTSNLWQTLDTSVYSVYQDEEPGSISLAYQQSWPSILGERGDVRILYWAGYGDAASDVPGPIRQAILALIGSIYEFREDLATGPVIKNEAAERLLWPYRTWLEYPWR